MQLQQARSQLAKEKSKRKEDVLQLTQCQLTLETKVETMEKLATQATKRVKELETTIHLSKLEARRWAQEQAVEMNKEDAATYGRDIQLLRQQLQEARAQLRASAAASLQQFGTASETLSPDWKDSSLERDGGVIGGSGSFGGESSRGGAGTPPALDLTTHSIRTPHPKRRAPPPPVNTL